MYSWSSSGKQFLLFRVTYHIPFVLCDMGACACNSVSNVKVPGQSCDVVEAENFLVLSQSSGLAANQRPSIGPVTPDLDRENGEGHHDLSSPLTVISSPPNAPCFDSTECRFLTSADLNGSETPKEALFDSFAPGPDKFMLVAQRSKYWEESQTHVARRLNFTCLTNVVRDISYGSNIGKISDEDYMFDIVYGAILDAIVSEQTKELVTNFPTQVTDLDMLRTPKSAPRLTGVAETCPAAPMKSTSKYRNIDKKLCRKLAY